MMIPASTASVRQQVEALSAFDWPTFGLEDDIRPALGRAMAAGESSALATLYAVRGGTPRGVGAQMLFTHAALSGFLSGGCIEADVALHAAAVLTDGAPRRLTYGDGGPLDIRLPCGSRIDVLVERLLPADPAAGRLVALSAKRRPLVWITDGAVRTCAERSELRHAALPRDPVDISWECQDDCVFSEVPFRVCRFYAPQTRLVVIGTDPVALALLRLGSEMGFETVLLRPRGPEGAPPGAAHYLRQELPDALATLGLDPWTAVAIITHEPALEQEALAAILPEPVFYLGALGSQRRIPERNRTLRAAGFSRDQIKSVHAPIGLPIGGKAPWEIAVSIMAEIIAGSRLAAAPSAKADGV